MSLIEVPMDSLTPSPMNPRTDFGDIDELANSMANGVGVIQPITVRPLPGVEGQYEIVVGGRRYLAAKKAGIKMMPVSIRNLADDEVMRMQVVENLQRQDLTPVEEGKMFKDTRDQFGYSGAEIARMIGMRPTYVTTRIQMLNLAEEIRTKIVAADASDSPKTMTFHKAQSLIPLSEEKRTLIARRISERGMTSEQVRTAIRKADEVETIIAKVRRAPLRKKLEEKYLHRVFDADVKPADILVEIDRELGKPTGPSQLDQYNAMQSRVAEMRRPYMHNSFVRVWKQGDRHFVQATVWMDFGDKVTHLERMDYAIEDFIDFESADQFAADRGGYCTGIIALKKKKFWCIYVP